VSHGARARAYTYVPLSRPDVRPLSIAPRTIIHDALVRLSDGDRSALAVLLTELWPRLLAFARRGVSVGADAEDVAQEAFVRICARIGELDRTRDGFSWAFAIASYEVLTHRRRVQRRREVNADAPLAALRDQSASPEDVVLAHEIAAAFESAVGALTDDDRRALGLLAPPPPGQPLGPAHRKRRQRALERLRDVWRRLYGEP